MKEALSIETERTDDIPLLLTHMQRMQLASLLDKHFPTHGLRKGLSMGELIQVWLTHVLSQADHRMNRVQDWASRRLTTLRECGLESLTPLDVTDDRLADVLRALYDDERYRAFEQELMGHLLRVYALEASCVRLDTTTVSSYADVNEEGLLQLGHSKDHRPDLPQVKIALTTLDPFGVPLASEVLSGEQADDPVYVPLIDRVHQGLARTGLLYVGDCKMAAEKTRAHVQAQGDFYLCPLSALHVPPATLAHSVETYLVAGTPLVQVVREDEGGQPKCIAQGYETLVEMEVVAQDRTVCWQERRLMIQSIDGSLAAQTSLQDRLEKAEKAIGELMVRKQGKPRLTSRSQVEEQVQSILSSLRVEGVSKAQVARTSKKAPSTIQLWIKRYQEKGLAGLANNVARSDKGKSRKLEDTAIQLIEGLALQKPPRSMAAIHRQVTTIAREQGWNPPSYDRVRHIIKSLDPALVTFAHQGAAAYREEFDLLYRREASHANAMWQADHTPLDIFLLDEAGKPAKPWLTAIEDDYSRMIMGYRLGFQESTALTTALTLRQAICRKEDPRWHSYGIPTVFYTDHGSDFTSKHLEQVAADLPMELIFSQVSIPRGRGKIERFFRSVDQLLLQDTPGYAPKGSAGVKAVLTLPAFEQRFRAWLLEDYHTRVHVETGCKPAERWEAGGFVPRMLKSLEQLDLLLLTVAKTRRVQQDGIRFQGYRYIDATLAGYVKEEVVIRYDPIDMAEIRVFHQDRFVCRAICQELSGQTVSLKEIEKARSERRKQVRAGLSTRAAIVEQFIAVHQPEETPFVARDAERDQVERPRLKRYIHE